MLSKEKRLNLKKDFTWVASGRKTGNYLVKIYFRSGENPSEASGQVQPRVGIALSKSVFKKAVDRNRARRLVSKGFEFLYNQLPQGINIVAIPRSGVLNLNSEEFTKFLEILLKKEKILK